MEAVLSGCLKVNGTVAPRTVRYGRRVIAMAALALVTGFNCAAFAQPNPNIAGNYRGVITTCIVATEPDVCRAALAELVRLAVEVDVKRAARDAAEVGGDIASALAHHSDYELALQQLNNGITSFNRDIAGPRQRR